MTKKLHAMAVSVACAAWQRSVKATEPGVEAIEDTALERVLADVRRILEA